VNNNALAESKDAADDDMNARVRGSLLLFIIIIGLG